MKIAIISDTHDNLATLDKFLDFIGKNPVETIIHCGDIAEGGTLRHLAKKFPNRVTLFDDFGQAEFNGIKIGFCHHKETALRHCRGEKFEYIFYGHTHKPWTEKIETCRLSNPGTLAGMFYLATFAILDAESGKLELKILNRL